MKNLETQIEQETLKRRSFLRKAGLVTAGGLALPAAAWIKPQQHSLTQDELALAAELIAALKEKDITLDLTLIMAALTFGIDMFDRYEQTAERDEKKRQEYLRERDSLKGSERVNFVIEKLKGRLRWYCPDYQRRLLTDFTLKGGSPKNESEAYVVRVVAGIFEGCSRSFKREVIQKYLDEVLPPLEVEHEKEMALEEALNEFVGLTNGKNLEQVRAMIETFEGV